MCAATVTTSPVISGNWGILYPRITDVRANDPTDKNAVYSFLDTITITYPPPAHSKLLRNVRALRVRYLTAMSPPHTPDGRVNGFAGGQVLNRDEPGGGLESSL